MKQTLPDKLLKVSTNPPLCTALPFVGEPRAPFRKHGWLNEQSKCLFGPDRPDHFPGRFMDSTHVKFKRELCFEFVWRVLVEQFSQIF